MLRCTKPQDSLLMSLSSKKRPTQSSCLRIPQRLPMLLPLKTMLRLLDVALSQNPYTTLQYLVLPISPTTFYISKYHDIPSVSSSPNPPKTIHVVCANSRRPTVNVRLPKPRPHKNHVQEVSIFTLYVLLPKDRAKTLDVVCIKFQGNS
jgi:hypothetical protein